MKKPTEPPTLLQLCGEATPGPWGACHDGRCSCKTVWSKTADHPVAEIVHGEWGDRYPALKLVDGGSLTSISAKVEATMELIAYGKVQEEAAAANAQLIARCNPQTMRQVREVLDNALGWMQSMRDAMVDMPEEMDSDADEVRAIEADMASLRRALALLDGKGEAQP